VTVRPFNTYGPRQSARAVIPSIITQALAGRDVRLGNLSPTRDLNFVEDTVEGFIAAAAAAKAAGRTFNLGTGKEISVGSLAKLILALLGRNVPIVQEKIRRRGAGTEVERLCADARLARKALGWKPAHSLEDGLRKTIAWIERNQSHYRPDVYAV
jgi:dTDP-glucose 4,6-dehydratase